MLYYAMQYGCVLGNSMVFILSLAIAKGSMLLIAGDRRGSMLLISLTHTHTHTHPHTHTHTHTHSWACGWHAQEAELARPSIQPPLSLGTSEAYLSTQEHYNMSCLIHKYHIHVHTHPHTPTHKHTHTHTHTHTLTPHTHTHTHT